MGRISDGIIRFVAGKRVVPPVPPTRKIVLIGEIEPGTSPRRDRTSGLALFIEYQDAKSDRSHRRIVCKSYNRTTDVITAWCFERDAVRAFRTDRIISAACTETGELFELDDLISRLKSNGLPVRDAGLNAVLTLLIFLMRCDGVAEEETIALEEAITSYAIRFDGDDAMVEQALKQARTMAPDERDFLKALRFIARREDGPALARFVRSQARRIIDADGMHSPEETAFASELDRYLAEIALRN